MADFTDSFDGSGPPDSAHWTTFVGAAERSGGALVPTEAPYAATLTAPTLGADQWVEAEIASVANEVGIIVRSPVAGSGYALWGNPAGGPLLEGYFITRFASGVSTDLAQVSTTGPVPGDVLGLRIVGSTLQATRNGEDLGDPVTDTTYTGPGQAGVALIGAGDSIAWFRARDVVSPMPVSAATHVPAESIAQRTAAATTAAESLSARVRASSTPHESRSFATRAGPASVEWIARPTRAGVVAAEQLGRITRDAISPREYIARTTAAWVSPWASESVAPIARSTEAAYEFTAGVRRSASSPWEAGGLAAAASSAQTSPFEFLGLLVRIEPAPYESVGRVVRTLDSAHEQVARVVATLVTETESARRVLATIIAPWESGGLAAVIASRISPYEALGHVERFAVAPDEQMGHIVATQVATWETQAPVARVSSSAHESTLSVRRAVTSALAWLGRVFRGSVVAWEALGSEKAPDTVVRVGVGRWYAVHVDGRQLAPTVRGDAVILAVGGHDITPPVVGGARTIADDR